MRRGAAGRWEGVRLELGRPVSSASLAFLRIAFGVAMVVNTALYVPVLVREYYVDPSVHFPYGPFTFVRPLPGAGMYLAYGAMACTGALIALGLWYRWAAGAFFLITTYVFLLDSTYYQNHEYLISLLALLLTLLPAHCRWSLDARRRPEVASDTVPSWMVWLLRFQIGVPYFFGGVAKLNGDWLRGEPLRAWLAARTDIEPFASILRDDGVVWFMTYGALVLDLAVVGLLLYRPTRVPAYAVVTAFHLLNVWLFGLYIFPWLMIAATTIFFPPTWPHGTRAWLAARVPALGPVRGRGPWSGEAGDPPAPVPAGGGSAAAGGRRRLLPAVAVAASTLWIGTQLLVPLRHHAIEGNPSWTEQAHRFSWHMRLRTKDGWVRFTVDDGVRSFQVDPHDHLGTKQTARLPGHPERLVQFARHLSDLHDGAEVRADTMVSLNGRDHQPFVDPDVDLASVTYESHRPNDWVLPLEEPLR
jgi:vitamin K-dependent gamma-carboxylase